MGRVRMYNRAAQQVVFPGESEMAKAGATTKNTTRNHQNTHDTGEQGQEQGRRARTPGV